jgi:peroxiredoxin
VTVSDRILGRGVGERGQLLVFERGHWCRSCLRQLGQFDESVQTIGSAGFDLIVVTHEAEDKTGRHPYPVIADPSLEVGNHFSVVGIDEVGFSTLRPTSLVLDRDGLILFSYVGDDSTDRPTVAEMLLAIRNVSGRPLSDS